MGAERSSAIPALVGMACMGAAFALVSQPAVTSIFSHPALITALVALATLAVGVSLFWSMELRRERVAVRLMIGVPIVLSVVVTVALMLDAHFRGHGLVNHG